jgi:WD40 repeat protein/serine/threonine protein kinase
MGVVYLAEQESLSRQVALKVIRSESLHVAGSRERFRREALAASRLDHPGICPIYEVGEFDGVPYMVMRLIEGESLSCLINRAREAGSSREVELPLGETQTPPSGKSDSSTSGSRSQLLRIVSMAEKVARALHTAHEAGLVHRDIKPGNIMVDRAGEPVLLDFGLARDESRVQQSLTASGDLLGTPAYMSPEQLTQRVPLDRRTDIYSLGVALYECLTLRSPFEAPSRELLYQRIISTEYPDPRRFNRSLPKDLKIVLDTALEKDRNRRYQTAFELAEDLRRIRSLEPIHAKPIGPVLRLRRWVQRSPVAATTLALVTLGLAVSLWLLAQRNAALRAMRSLALTAAAAEEVQSDPMLALLLAREAEKVDPGSSQALSQVHNALGRLHERKMLEGIRGAERMAAVSPKDSGRDLLLTVMSDGTARIWDWEGEEQARLRASGGKRILRLAFSPDGKRVVGICVPDNTIRVWDLAGNELCDPLKGHNGWVSTAVLSPEGDRVLSVGSDRTARLWDLATGEHTVILDDRHLAGFLPTQTYPFALFSPDGKHILAGSANGTAWLCDTDGRNAVPLRHEGPIVRGVFSRDGSKILTASWDKTACLWDLDGNRVVLKGHEHIVRWARFSPTEDRIVTASRDGTARLWDLDGTELAVLRGHTGGVDCPVFSPDGKRVLTVSWDGTARLWDLDGRELAVLRGHDHHVVFAAFSRDGKRIFTTSATARIWDSSPALAPLPHGSPVMSVRIHPENGQVLTAARDGKIRLWTEEGELIRVFPHGIAAAAAVFLPGNEGILTVGPKRRVLLWDRDSGQPVELAGHRTVWLSCASISADGTRIATGDGMGTVLLWDRRSSLETPQHEYNANASVWTVDFSPDGGSLLLGRGLAAAQLWKVETPELPPRSFPGVRCAAFSPDGKSVLTGCADWTVRLWDLQVRELRAFTGHEGSIRSVTFSPDGRLIATTSTDKTARIWSLDDEHVVAVLRGHEGTVTSAAFSTDGTHLFTASFDGTVRRWRVDPKDVLSLARERATRKFTAAEKTRYAELLGSR